MRDIAPPEGALVGEFVADDDPHYTFLWRRTLSRSFCRDGLDPLPLDVPGGRSHGGIATKEGRVQRTRRQLLTDVVRRRLRLVVDECKAIADNARGVDLIPRRGAGGPTGSVRAHSGGKCSGAG